MKVYINGGPFHGQIHEVPDGMASTEFLVPPRELPESTYLPGDEVVFIAPMPVERVVRDIRLKYLSCTASLVFTGTSGYEYDVLSTVLGQVQEALFARAPLVKHCDIRHHYIPYPYDNEATELLVEGIVTWNEVTWNET